VSLQEDASDTAADKAGGKATVEAETPFMKPQQWETRLEMIWPRCGSRKKWG